MGFGKDGGGFEDVGRHFFAIGADYDVGAGLLLDVEPDIHILGEFEGKIIVLGVVFADVDGEIVDCGVRGGLDEAGVVKLLGLLRPVKFYIFIVFALGSQ